VSAERRRDLVELAAERLDDPLDLVEARRGRREDPHAQFHCTNLDSLCPDHKHWVPKHDDITAADA